MIAPFLLNSFLPTFLASILGSTHCIAMCGGFSCLAGSNNHSKPRTQSLTGISLYNIGRLLSYLIIVNSIYAFDISLRNLSILSSFAGILLLAIMLSQLGQLMGLGHLIAKNKLIKFFSESFINYYAVSLSKITNSSSSLKTLFLGILTTLIPCGWLYLNLGLASAQENIFKSNLIIFAFWLGTVPALSAVGLSAGLITKRFSGLSKIIAYIIVILLSLYSLSRHFPEVFSKVGLTDALCHITNIKDQ